MEQLLFDQDSRLKICCNYKQTVDDLTYTGDQVQKETIKFVIMFSILSKRIILTVSVPDQGYSFEAPLERLNPTTCCVYIICPAWMAFNANGV